MNQTHVLDRPLRDALDGVNTGRDPKADGREDQLTAPDRSIQQRRDALRVANEVRTTRAEFKRDLKAGRKDVVGMILDPPEWMLTMHLFDLLISVPKLGRVKVNRILTQCRISPSKTVGGLSERQRGEIVSYLRRQ